MALDFEQLVLDVPGVRSLTWDDDTLVDWVAGGTRIRLDGSVQRARVNFAYRFDGAIVSPSKRFVALYERLGTKALLLDRGAVLRELNRSFYHAHVYEYPITFLARPNGTELLVHCPREYCRIDIDDAVTGMCLTDASGRKPRDIFHSRLATSPRGTWLTSAGWVWHPFGVATWWPVEAALAEPALLDKGRSFVGEHEVESISFLDDTRLVAATGDDETGTKREREALSVIDLENGRVSSRAPLATQAGTVVGFTKDTALCLFSYPRIFRVVDGSLVAEWPHLRSGLQSSSIIRHVDPVPPFAKHPTKAMFAVASEQQVVVIRAAAVGAG